MSGECMRFPATPAGFIESFSFIDKEQVYTNGAELISVYRVNEMIEHYFQPVHGTWETSVMYDGDGNKVFRHIHRGCGFGCSSYKERGTPYCPNCGAIMDGRVEE